MIRIHRRLWSLLAVLALCAPGAFAQTAAPPAAPPSARLQEVLALHARALGGLDRLRALSGIRTEGEVSAGGLHGTFRGFQALPDRNRNDLDLNVVRQVQVLDHGKAWIQDANGQVRDANGDELKGLISEASIAAYRYLLGTPAEVAVALSSDPDDSSQFVTLQVTPKGGDPVRIALDTTTWLPRKLLMESAGGPVAVYLADFRDVGGVRMPYLSLQVLGGDSAHAITTTTTLAEAVATLPDSLWRRPGATAPDWSFPEGTHALSIPVRVMEHHVFVPVRINGSGPYYFLLDTGAGATAVDPHRAGALGLKSEGRLGAQGVGGNADYGYTLVDTLDVGGVQLFGQHVITLALPDFESVSGLAVDGILGYDFFARFVVTIDYARQQLTLSDPASWQAPAGATFVPIDLVQNVPAVDAFYDGKPGRYLVDTGNNGSLLLHGPYVRKHRLLYQPRKRLDLVVRGAGGEETQMLVRGANLQIGREVIREPLVALSNSSTGLTGATSKFAGNIGGWVLDQFTVSFDYTHHKMCLEHGGNFGRRMDLDPTGWQLVRKDGKLRVATITRGTPAALAGAKEEDEVLQLEGTDISQRTPYEVKQLTQRPDGTALHFTVRRGGQLVELVITARRLL